MRNKDIYEDLVKNLMVNVYDGYNSTLFAYGQTGSGKSWTIEGGENEQGVL